MKEEDMGSSNNKQVCIFCGSDENMTVDHIPPKSLFPKPRPNDMFTVPCCDECNTSFEKDDEYFRGVLASGMSLHDDENANKVNEKFLSGIRRKQAKGLKKTFEDSIRILDVKSKGGIFVGKMPALQIDAKRIQATVERITKGLFYKIRGYPLPEGHKIDLFLEDSYLQLSEGIFDTFTPHWSPLESIGGGIFKYRYAECVDTDTCMPIIFSFYDKLFFHVIITPEITE